MFYDIGCYLYQQFYFLRLSWAYYNSTFFAIFAPLRQNKQVKTIFVQKWDAIVVAKKLLKKEDYSSWKFLFQRVLIFQEWSKIGRQI